MHQLYMQKYQCNKVR